MIILKRELCVHCGACRQYCKFDAIVSEEGRMKILQDRCVQCGKCIKACYMLAIRKEDE